jgi:hypothetical protein
MEWGFADTPPERLGFCGCLQFFVARSSLLERETDGQIRHLPAGLLETQRVFAPRAEDGVCGVRRALHGSAAGASSPPWRFPVFASSELGACVVPRAGLTPAHVPVVAEVPWVGPVPAQFRGSLVPLSGAGPGASPGGVVEVPGGAGPGANSGDK